MTKPGLHRTLLFASAASWLIAAIAQFAAYQYTGLGFSFVAASTGFALYFTGKAQERFLNERIRDLETERLGRHLDDASRGRFLNALRTMEKPSQSIELSAQQGDAEAISLGKEIKAVLEEGGFPVDGVWGDSIIGATASGILVRHSAETASQARTIATILTRAGLAVRLVELAHKGQRPLQIFVAYKPRQEDVQKAG